MNARGCQNVVELSWWDEHIHSPESGFKMVATPCQHWCKRTATDTNKVIGLLNYDGDCYSDSCAYTFTFAIFSYLHHHDLSYCQLCNQVLLHASLVEEVFRRASRVLSYSWQGVGGIVYLIPLGVGRLFKSLLNPRAETLIH